MIQLKTLTKLIKVLILTLPIWKQCIIRMETLAFTGLPGPTKTAKPDPGGIILDDPPEPIKITISDKTHMSGDNEDKPNNRNNKGKPGERSG